MQNLEVKLDLISSKVGDKDYRSVLFRDKDQIKGSTSDDLLEYVKGAPGKFKIKTTPGERLDYDFVRDWSFPVNDLNTILVDPENIKIKNLETDEYGLLQLKKSAGSFSNLLYSKASYSDSVVFYRLVVDALENAELNRLKDTVDESIKSLNDASYQISVSKGEIANQKSNLETLKGKGTFFRPDNDIRNDRANEKLNELFDLLETCQAKIAHYKSGLEDLKQIACDIRRWSNNLNNQPFAVLGSNMFKRMIIDPQPSGIKKATNSIAWICLGLGGIGLIAGLAVYALGSFSVLAISSMGPVGWLITGLLLTIGTVLLIISSIQEANELKDYYEKSIDASEENIEKAKNIIAQLNEAQSLLDKAFASVEAVVRQIDSADSKKQYSHADLHNKLQIYEYASARFLAGQKIMDRLVENNKKPDIAAELAADTLSLDIADNPQTKDPDFSAQIYLMGYYIRNNKIAELKGFMEEHGSPKENVHKTLIITLLINSNSPDYVIEKLKEIEGKVVAREEIEAVRKESLNVVLFAAA